MKKALNKGSGIHNDDDFELVSDAREGSYKAVESLIAKHQSFIYNMALQMTGSSDDAEDVTQEILIKVFTKLSTFNFRSSFKTWLYRIVANHVLNMKRTRKEEFVSSFDSHRIFLESVPDMEYSVSYGCEAEQNILFEETKKQCLNGMLLCLDRMQRLVFLLGAVFGMDSRSGGEILGLSPENYRKRLSRGRALLQNYMNENCSLINKNGTCRCSRKTRYLVDNGYINPEKLDFSRYKKENSALKRVADETLELTLDAVFRDSAGEDSADYNLYIRDVIRKMQITWNNHGFS